MGFSQGEAVLVCEPNVGILLEKHKELNSIQASTDGFRIQIFMESGNYSKKKAYTIKKSFADLYPDEQVYVLFNEPYYKVRIGDFRSRLDAERELENVVIDYPVAFIVPDKIRFPVNSE